MGQSEGLAATNGLRPASPRRTRRDSQAWERLVPPPGGKCSRLGINLGALAPIHVLTGRGERLRHLRRNLQRACKRDLGVFQPRRMNACSPRDSQDFVHRRFDHFPRIRASGD